MRVQPVVLLLLSLTILVIIIAIIIIINTVIMVMTFILIKHANYNTRTTRKMHSVIVLAVVVKNIVSITIM